MGDEIPQNAITSTPEQEYYLQEKAKIHNSMAETQQQLQSKRDEEQNKAGKGTTGGKGGKTPSGSNTGTNTTTTDQTSSSASGKQFGMVGTGKNRHFSVERFREDYQAWLDKTIDEEISKLDADAMKDLQKMGIDVSKGFDDVTKDLLKQGNTDKKSLMNRTEKDLESQYQQKQTRIASDPTISDTDKNKQLYDAEREHLETMKAGSQNRLYSRPTHIGNLGLVAEQGNEIVISNPHVRHLQMNYPEVISTIYRTAARVPQFAQGNYPAAGSGAGTQPGQQQSNGKEDLMIELLKRIASSNEKPLRAYIPYNDLNDTFNEVEGIEKGLK